MSAALIDGKAISAKVNQETADMVEALKKQGVHPCLAVILIGEDPASQIYVRSKVARCAELGILSRKHVLPQDASPEDVFSLIDSLNKDPEVHGILVQFPPPPPVIDISCRIESFLIEMNRHSVPPEISNYL